jgi:hypothetical protein
MVPELILAYHVCGVFTPGGVAQIIPKGGLEDLHELGL